MTPAQLALAAAALLCARAEMHIEEATLTASSNNNPEDKANELHIGDATLKASSHNNREARAYGVGLPTGCLYGDHWYSEGATVPTREECLRCVCLHGALSCRRRACENLPDPLPPRCHVRHRRGTCCPELQCPDGVKITEHGAVAKFELEHELEAETVTPSTANLACVEGGTVFAAGSAMGSRVACETCFCLRGSRRCVRPRCLPPPPHCAPRPASGACCPQRYYCDRTTDRPDQNHTHYDCRVDGTWVSEGSKVSGGDNCSSCFCLRGQVRCQAMSCAPPLAGCRPLLALGDCCAHQYICDHHHHELPSYILRLRENLLSSTGSDERAFHSSKTSKIESTTKNIMTNIYTLKNTPIASPSQNHLIATTKVKRKTDEPSLSSSEKPDQITNNTLSLNITTTKEPSNAAKLIALYNEAVSTDPTMDKTTEQPEGTVKIVINGTVNCTAELSSTSLPLSIPVINDTDKLQIEAMPRVPIVNVEAQTYSPNDIITDRNINGGFDENDTFTINVTSSLMANTSRSTSKPVMTVSKIPAPSDLGDTLNSSKKTKGDYDYDYAEPTLPPSLPNLKIIPFVAADAVVDDDSTKDALSYPELERDDKFPVYYPSADEKDIEFPTRREEIYHPTQYPVFSSDEVENSYPPMAHDVDLTGDRYPIQNNVYTVSTSLGGGSHMPDVKDVTRIPTTSTTFALETPAVNLFSPPVETEGGFVPKGPGIIDEYYAMVYPSTPSGPVVPHLTTSMQLDTYKGKCTSQDGQSVANGESIIVGCMQCRCNWEKLGCTPRPCHAAPGCVRQPPAEAAAMRTCCGNLICDADTKNQSTSLTAQNEDTNNETKVEDKNVTLQQSLVGSQSNITNIAISDNTNIGEAANIAEDISIAQTNDVILESTRNTTTDTPATSTSAPKITTSTVSPSSTEVNYTSHEYEDDDEDGFSLGSVLKLLLSDYETTTLTTVKKPSNRLTTQPTFQTKPSTRRPSTTAPFVPLPPQAYVPSKKSPSTVNRIDHLVLGEATAIKRTTLRPITNKVTKRPIQETTTERRPDIKEKPIPSTSMAHEGPRPPNLGLQGVGPGLLKLAGCNIYGRMYRVGRIIAELSTPCQECWCTEFGVQCKPLGC